MITPPVNLNQAGLELLELLLQPAGLPGLQVSLDVQVATIRLRWDNQYKTWHDQVARRQVKKYLELVNAEHWELIKEKARRET